MDPLRSTEVHRSPIMSIKSFTHLLFCVGRSPDTTRRRKRRGTAVEERRRKSNILDTASHVFDSNCLRSFDFGLLPSVSADTHLLADAVGALLHSEPSLHGLPVNTISMPIVTELIFSSGCCRRLMLKILCDESETDCFVGLQITVYQVGSQLYQPDLIKSFKSVHLGAR